MPEPTPDPIEAAAASLRAGIAGPPRVLVVLGSGLDAAAAGFDESVSVPVDRIPHWPLPSVAGHAGRIGFGRLGPHPAAVLRGRVHLYEGHSPERVVFPVRVLARLGVRAAVLTCAAGGLDPGGRAGDLLLVRDHLDLQGALPGPGPGRTGIRVPVGDGVYDPGLREAALEAAEALRVPLRDGVYAAVTGPTYETRAETRMLRVLGADAVGMSLVLEAAALRREGVRVAAVAVIANVAGRADGGAGAGVSHGEVLAAGARAAGDLGRLLAGWVARIPL